MVFPSVFTLKVEYPSKRGDNMKTKKMRLKTKRRDSHEKTQLIKK